MLGCTCTLPSYMTGSWYDNKFIEAEFSSRTVMYLNQYSITRSGSTTNLTCHITSGNKYIMRTSDTLSATISGVPGDYYYYVCMEVTKITEYSFYHYMQSGFENDALQLCSEPFLGNFSFTLYDTLNTESTGYLNSCTGTKTTINMTYSKGAGNTLKIVKRDGTGVSASQRVRMCHEGQESTSKPSDTTPLYPTISSTSGGLLTLTPYGKMMKNRKNA
ncbi:unnamed protein product [Mytilus coruscus]|uniref:Uncharacterized protein n=1 Tax=Mytilus coruscus TaxID=42192 RepID=A0A6J8BEB7_MYTCO|nr:unnamed protein product [Mytilus coruscus]